MLQDLCKSKDSRKRTSIDEKEKRLLDEAIAMETIQNNGEQLLEEKDISFSWMKGR